MGFFIEIAGVDCSKQLISFNLIKKKNFHSRCCFEIFQNDNHGEYKEDLEKQLCVKNQDNQIVFLGVISEIEELFESSGNRLRYTALSYSIKEDNSLYSRIFHNSDQFWSDILQEKILNSSLPIVLSNKLANGKCDKIIIQNSETNFCFLKKVALFFNLNLWIKDTVYPSELILSETLYKEYKLVDFADIVSLSIKKTSCGITCSLSSNKLFQLGEFLQINKPEYRGFRFFISEVEVKYEQGSFNYYYFLETLKDQDSNVEKTFLLKNAILHKAKVVSVDAPNKQQKIKVNFIDIDDMNINDSSWIDYVSPYCGSDGGLYFTPDIGDTVVILISRDSAIAFATVRNDDFSLSEDINSQSEKYIGNNFNQRIIFKKDSLEIKSGTYSIVLDKKGITLTNGKSNIILEDKIKINSSQGSIELADSVEISGKKIIFR